MAIASRFLAAGVALAGALVATAAQAAIYIEQSGTVAQTEVFAHRFAGTADEAYAYSTISGFSYNGDVEHGLPLAEAGVATVFLVETDEGLTLFTVFDATSSSGGRQNSRWTYLDGNRSGAVLVNDDSPNRDAYDRSSNTFNFEHAWAPGFTDGFVFDISGGPFDLQGELLAAGATWLTSLVFVTPDTNDNDIVLSLHDAFRIYGDSAETPIPGAVAFGALGFAGLVGLDRRRRR
ncbi:MAG: hypothetical protein AAGI89_11035 [Pseudomonadota bacterium]